MLPSLTLSTQTVSPCIDSFFVIRIFLGMNIAMTCIQAEEALGHNSTKDATRPKIISQESSQVLRSSSRTKPNKLIRTMKEFFFVTVHSNEVCHRSYSYRYTKNCPTCMGQCCLTLMLGGIIAQMPLLWTWFLVTCFTWFLCIGIGFHL